MRALVIVMLGLLLATAPANAQGPTISPAKAADAKRGRQMVIAGVVLAAGGLAVLPVTAKAADQAKGAALVVPMGMLGGGAGLAWFGARKARNATRPQTTFGVTAGTANAVFVRRVW